MSGVIYVSCTNVGRSIVKSHLRFHKDIPILGIINLSFKESINKSNYDNLYDLSYKNKIPIHYCESINSEETAEFINSKNPNILIQSGWSQKFGKRILSLPKYGCIGEHPSPIPEGRGAACVNWALIEGKKNWGDTFFKMVEKYDAGPVYAQEYFQISENDNCRTVYDKVALTSYKIIKENLSIWNEGDYYKINIDESKATYYKKRSPSDGKISFSWPLKKILAYINALTKPYPGAFFPYKDDEVIIWDAEDPNLSCYNKKSGTILDIDEESIYVVTGDSNLIKINKLESNLIPELNGSEFYNSYFNENFEEIILE
jgi:methionyl-tRNA formyltransferase